MNLQATDATEAYLAPCEIIDFDHPAIQRKAAELHAAHRDRRDLACASFEFVRDEIAHSWDARQGPVTLKASEVLAAGYGYCYAKSHLLAGLLRANNIPAGLCYQRLSQGDSGPPFCLHGLNAVWLEGGDGADEVMVSDLDGKGLAIQMLFDPFWRAAQMLGQRLTERLGIAVGT